MYELQQICRFMEQWAPPALAEEWDNPGLLVDAGSLVRRVLVTLDITPAVVEEAHRLGCQLVVSHHPVIFKPVRRLQSADAAFLLARYGISALCAHTNLDAAEGGVNDVLAGLLELEDVQPLEGLGRVGDRDSISPAQLSEQVGKLLNTPVLLADAGLPITRVAVVGGSGGEFFEAAARAGAQCLVTGEASHHHGLDALEQGVSVIVAGHFATEWPIVPEMARRLRQAFGELEVLVSGSNRPPFHLAGR